MSCFYEMSMGTDMDVSPSALSRHPRLKLIAVKHPDLVFNRFEPASAKSQKLRTALISRQKLVKR